MAAKIIASLKKRSMAAARASAGKTVATAKAPVEIVPVAEVAAEVVAVVEPAPVVVEVAAPVVPVMEPAVASELAIAACPTAACLAAIDGLRSLDADVARDAATALGELGEAAAVEPLIGVVINADGFHHGVVRAAAATSLGQLGDGRAVDALVGLVDHWMAEASAEAVRALAKLGDARATEMIRSVVDDRTGYYAPIVRHAAEAALPRLMAV